MGVRNVSVGAWLALAGGGRPTQTVRPWGCGLLGAHHAGDWHLSCLFGCWMRLSCAIGQFEPASAWPSRFRLRREFNRGYMCKSLCLNSGSYADPMP